MSYITPDELNQFTPEQRSAYLTALARLENQSGRSQKLRTAAQGATFGFADEIEAGVKSLVGEETYRQNVDKIRAQIKQYREDAPVESAVYEIAGAIAPALLSRGASAPLSMTQIAGRAIGEGAVSGYGSSEGDIVQQLTQTATGAGLGGVVGTAATYGMKGLGVIADKVVDSMRRLTGGRGATVVENEILRLSQQSGETPDEIVARIARGEIMADNKSLQMALRDLMSRGGLAESEIRTLLPQRAESLRLEGQAALKSGLAPNAGDNVLQYARMNQDDFKQAEKAAYNQIFSAGIEVPQLGDTLMDIAARLPNAKQAIDELYKTTKGSFVPPFKIGDNGAIEMVRVPTLEDAEIMRRALQDAADQRFRAGSGAVGANLSDMESELRRAIDTASPELGATRANWRKYNQVRNAFDEGRKAFNLPPEQLEVDFLKIADNPELAASFREGVMAQINNKLARQGSKQLMRKLSDPNTLEGKLFETVFPEDMKRQALNKLLTASSAQDTFEKVIGGSTTALTQGARSQSNLGIGLDEVMGAARMNPLDIARVGAKIVKGMAPDLNDAQRKQITDILISTDPDIVRKALTDDSAMARLQNQIALMSRKLQASAKTVGAVSGGTAGAYTSGQFFEDR